MSLQGLPLRLSTGPYLAWTGWRKLEHPEERGEGLLHMASHSAPQLRDRFGANPPSFARALGATELALGVWLTTGRRSRLAGAALAGFSLGTLSLLYKTPGMLVEGSRWEPSQQGMAISKDVWMLGAGLALLLGA